MSSTRPRQDTSAGEPLDPSRLRLATEVYRCVVQSEIEGGVRIQGLADGTRVVVRTSNRTYQIQVREGQTWLSGHPRFCPSPVAVRVCGSSWGGSMFKPGYLGLGMHMEFAHPEYSTVTTSKILSLSVD